MAANDHAVVVGIDGYPGFSDLGGACNDAAAMRDWLVDPAGGDVPEAQISLLRSTDVLDAPPATVEEARPLVDEMKLLFRPLLRQGLRHTSVGRRLYIFLAGHGFSVNDAKHARHAAVYAANAELVDAPHLVGSVYAAWFRQYAVFDEIVLIMDCCRSHDPLHVLDEHSLPKLPSRAVESARVRWMHAFAVQSGQKTRETTIGGEMRGIFTETVLQALRNARANQGGRVTTSTLKDYIHNNVARVAGDVEVGIPDFDDSTPREIVFGERLTLPSVELRIELVPARDARVLIYERPGDPPRVIEHVDGVATVHLEPGFYGIQVEGEDKRVPFEAGGAHAQIRL